MYVNLLFAHQRTEARPLRQLLVSHVRLRHRLGQALGEIRVAQVATRQARRRRRRKWLAALPHAAFAVRLPRQVTLR